MSSDSVKVAIKVRPLIKREKDENLVSQWTVQGNSIFPSESESKKRLEGSFTFDHVFDTNVTNKQIYETIVRPIVNGGVNGFNGTVFAYGQTSSGKTHTMMGTPEEPGIIRLAVNDMFDIIANTIGREFLLRVSYLEIYNEKVNDLLSNEVDLKLQEDVTGQVLIKCKEEVTNCPENVISFLKKGNKKRRVGETNMNERSSRGHTIFRITIESREFEADSDGAIQVSQLNLVDLAGSERVKLTGATGERFKEGKHINLSLSTLALVIKQLSESQDKHVNFRDSKLTRLLQCSLGGNANTAIICAVTPAAFEETQSTLSFASRAKNVKNKPQLNEVMSDGALLKRYAKQIRKLYEDVERLKLENEKCKNSTEEVKTMETWKKQLQESQRINEALEERIQFLKTQIICGYNTKQEEKSFRVKSKRRQTWGGVGTSNQMSSFQLNTDLPTIKEAASDTSQEDFTITEGQSIMQSIDIINETFHTELPDFELELINAERERLKHNYDDESDKSDDEELHVKRKHVNKVQFVDNVTVHRPVYECYPNTKDTSSQTLSNLQSPGTPKEMLRDTIQHLRKDYNELREYTTLEKQIMLEGHERCSEEIGCIKVERDKYKKTCREFESKLQKSLEETSELQKEINRINYENKIFERSYNEMQEKLLKLQKMLLEKENQKSDQISESEKNISEDFNDTEFKKGKEEVEKGEEEEGMKEKQDEAIETWEEDGGGGGGGGDAKHSKILKLQNSSMDFEKLFILETSLEEDNAKLSADLAAKVQESDELKNDVHSLKLDIENLQTIISQKELEDDLLRERVEEFQSKITKLTEEKINAEKELEAAKELLSVYRSRDSPNSKTQEAKVESNEDRKNEENLLSKRFSTPRIFEELRQNELDSLAKKAVDLSYEREPTERTKELEDMIRKYEILSNENEKLSIDLMEAVEENDGLKAKLESLEEKMRFLETTKASADNQGVSKNSIETEGNLPRTTTVNDCRESGIFSVSRSEETIPRNPATLEEISFFEDEGGSRPLCPSSFSSSSIQKEERQEGLSNLSFEMRGSSSCSSVSCNSKESQRSRKARKLEESFTHEIEELQRKFDQMYANVEALKVKVNEDLDQRIRNTPLNGTQEIEIKSATSPEEKEKDDIPNDQLDTSKNSYFYLSEGEMSPKLEKLAQEDDNEDKTSFNQKKSPRTSRRSTSSRIQQLQKDIDEVRGSLGMLKGDIRGLADLKNAYPEAMKDYVERAKFDALSQEYERLTETLDSYKSESNSRLELQGKLEILLQEREKVRLELDENEISLNLKNRELETYKGEIQKLKEKITLQLEEKEVSPNLQNKELEKYKGEIEELKQKVTLVLEDKEVSLNLKNKELEKYKGEIQELKEKITLELEKQDSLNLKNKELEKYKEEIQELKERNKELEEKEVLLNLKNEELEKYKGETEELKQKIMLVLEDKEVSLNLKNEELEKYKGEIQELKEIITLELEKQDSLNLKNKELEKYKEEIQELKERNKELEEKEVLLNLKNEELEKYKGETEELKQKVMLVLEDKEVSLNLKNEELEKYKGEIQELKEKITLELEKQDSLNLKNKELEKYKEEIQELKERNKELEEKEVLLNLKNEELEKYKGETEELKQKVTLVLEDKEVSLNLKNEELEKYKGEVQELKEKITLELEKQDSLNLKNKELEKYKEEIQELKERNKELEEKEVLLNLKNEELEKYKGETEELKQKVMLVLEDKEVSLNLKNKELEKYKGEVQELKEKITLELEKQDSLNLKNKELEKYKEEIQELKERNKELEEKEVLLNLKNEELEKYKGETEELKQKVTLVLEDKEVSLNLKNEELEKYKGEVQELKEKITLELEKQDSLNLKNKELEKYKEEIQELKERNKELEEKEVLLNLKNEELEKYKGETEELKQKVMLVLEDKEVSLNLKNKELEKYKGEVQELKEKITLELEKQDSLNLKNEELVKYKGEIQELKEKITLELEKQVSLNMEIKELKERISLELEEKEVLLNLKNQELEKYKGENQELKWKITLELEKQVSLNLEKKELEKYKGEVQKLKEKITLVLEEKENSLNLKNKELEKYKGEIDELKQKVRLELEEKEISLNLMNKELEKYQGENQELKEKITLGLEKQVSLNPENNELENYKKEIRELKETNKELDEECEELASKIRELFDENSEWQNKYYSLIDCENQLKKLTADLDGKDKKINELMEQLESLKKETVELKDQRNVTKMENKLDSKGNNGSTTSSRCSRPSVDNARRRNSRNEIFTQRRRIADDLEDSENLEDFEDVEGLEEDNSGNCRNCLLLKENIQKLEFEIVKKNGKIATLELQVESENFPYQKKCRSLEEDVLDLRNKNAKLKSEMIKLQKLIDDIGTRECEICQRWRSNRQDQSTQTLPEAMNYTKFEKNVSSVRELLFRRRIEKLVKRIKELEGLLSLSSDKLSNVNDT